MGYSVNPLKGKAYEWVKSLVVNNRDIADLWKSLDAHYGNEKHIVDTTINSLLSIPRCPNNIASLEKHFIDSKNAATNVANLGLNIDQLLASMYMLQIPGDYRSELERGLTNKKLDKYTFEDLSVLMEEMLRFHGH